MWIEFLDIYLYFVFKEGDEFVRCDEIFIAEFTVHTAIELVLIEFLLRGLSYKNEVVKKINDIYGSVLSVTLLKTG